MDRARHPLLRGPLLTLEVDDSESGVRERAPAGVVVRPGQAGRASRGGHGMSRRLWLPANRAVQADRGRGR